MTRDQRTTLFLAIAIVGGIGIGLSTILAVGPQHNSTPDTARIIAGTLITAFAMAWACFFAARAHFARDEYKRQREISASYWGGWLGIGASAPIFFFIAAGGFGPLAASSAPRLIIFMTGYLLPTLCAAIGAIGTALWLRLRDRS
jgi:hypothetical protein